jgi:hypothetical protein
MLIKSKPTIIQFKHNIIHEIFVLIACNKDASTTWINQDGPSARVLLCISIEESESNEAVIPESLYKITRGFDFIFRYFT